MRPCVVTQGEPPAKLPYRTLLDLWQTSEAMLAACAQSKQRLIDFYNDKVPDAPAPAKKPGFFQSFTKPEEAPETPRS